MERGVGDAWAQARGIAGETLSKSERASDESVSARSLNGAFSMGVENYTPRSAGLMASFTLYASSSTPLAGTSGYCQ